MAKVSATQRLIVEDFPDQKNWIGKMFYVINDFFEKSLGAINGGLEFKQNILGQENDIDFLYSSSSVTLPLSVKWGLNKPPRAVQVVAAYAGMVNDSLEVVSNKRLVPCLCVLAWEYTQEGAISITDFNILAGLNSTSAGPVSGQRILIRIRSTP